MLSLLGSLRGGSSFITRSLRFRSSASANLSRTPSVAGNRTVWTWSAWVKRGSLGSPLQYLFFAGVDFNNGSGVGFEATDQLIVVNYVAGTFRTNKVTTQVFRDPSAWYHIVVSQNGSTACNLYVNGTLITSFATNIGPDASNWFINNNELHTISKRTNAASNFFDGYLTEVNFIDGQALTPASFGAIDSSTGVWAPRPYSGTYGTNGFYLKFGNTSSVAALGTDSSGNNNTWTVNNVSLTAGATYDSMIDVPVNYADGGNGRGNYAVLNAASIGADATLSNGNLTIAYGGSGTRNATMATMGMSSGKWYWECAISAGTIAPIIGVTNTPSAPSVSNYPGFAANGWGYEASNGNKVNNLISVSYGNSYTTNDVVGVTFDADMRELVFYKNGVSQGVAYTGLVAGDYFPAFGDGQAAGTWTGQVNFGQRPFAYTPPAGFRALNTNNLPTPSIVNGANFMAATTYTGNAAARSLSNAVNSVSFQPDLVWIKSRTPGATSHALFDSTRGTGKYLSSDTTAAETTNANTLTAFNGDGFSLGTDTTIVNANANSYVAWQWRESITAGLDVVSYAGTGVNRTVAHNLGVAPAMIIVKRSQTGATSNWQVRHTSIAAANSIQLNSTNQAAAAATVWNSTAPTSSVFSLGTSTDVNASGISYVAYCFAEIAGFSRFGSYTGNGLADGPFVFCGFRPRWVMVKRTDTNGFDWRIFDVARNSSNVTTNTLFPNSALTEETTFNFIDILSNGLKPRSADNATNASGGTYIFAAFAEVPSKYALAR